MDWLTFATSLIGVGFIGALLRIWLGHRLKIEETKLAEQRQLQQKRREASAAVAEILGEWVRSAYTGISSNEDRWRLQTVYWRNILWLDKELVDLLAAALAHGEDAPSTNELIAQARKVLFGLSQPDISVAELITWRPKTEPLASQGSSAT